jgi:hypothetical protein
MKQCILCLFMIPLWVSKLCMHTVQEFIVRIIIIIQHHRNLWIRSSCCAIPDQGCVHYASLWWMWTCMYGLLLYRTAAGSWCLCSLIKATQLGIHTWIVASVPGLPRYARFNYAWAVKCSLLQECTTTKTWSITWNVRSFTAILVLSPPI